MIPSVEKLIETPPAWLRGGGDEEELVVSCRVRLARNLEKRAFTHRGDEETLAAVQAEVAESIASCESMKGALRINMDETTEPDRMVLAERRLISREMVKNYRRRSLAVGRDETLSIMINEEDHLRMQALESGLSIRNAFDRLRALDDELDARLPFAFSERFGYITACPTNVGTGLRVSAMMHLPGLVHNNDIKQVMEGLRQVRLTVRGTYGEGTEVTGNIFQISNSITLGQSEESTVGDLESHIRKLLEFEKKARKQLLAEARTLLEDKIWRAYGLLRTARLVTSKEAMGWLSAVRLGIGLGVITEVKIADLNELLIMIQPMHLQRLFRRVMGPEERDRVRADHIRQRFG